MTPAREARAASCVCVNCRAELRVAAALRAPGRLGAVQRAPLAGFVPALPRPLRAATRAVCWRAMSVSGGVYEGPKGSLRAVRRPLAACSQLRSRRPARARPPPHPVHAGAPVVTLYTKAECTLCDKVKEVLKTVAADAPHSLVQVLRARVHARACTILVSLDAVLCAPMRNARGHASKCMTV